MDASATPKKSFYDDVPADQVEWIGGHPVPPPPPVRPFHAIASVLRLVRNKEDTSQVFETISSLAGGFGKKMFRRFVATPYGKQVVSEPVRLERVLSDREALRLLPEGSVGRTYLAFMEGENLTADGLLEAAAEAGIHYDVETDFEQFRRMFLHLNVSHDLWHVMTGYGRDALGELCNLAYTYGQSRNRGFLLIIIIGVIAQKLEQPRAKIISSLMEARRNVKSANWIMEYDVEEMLKMPLDDARSMLKLGVTPVYNSVPAEVKASLLQPKTITENGSGAAAIHPAQ